MARIFKASSSAKPTARTNETTPRILAVTDLASDGRGVSRHQGKTVFVEGALPGEQVEIMHYRRHKQYSECQVKFVVEASTQRTNPFCQHFGTCGGCQLQHLSAESQLIYKQKALLSMLERQHKIVPKSIFPAIESAEKAYRSRARLGITHDRQLAFRAKSSAKLIPINSCLILADPLQELLPLLQTWVDLLPERAGVTHIELIAAQPQPAVVIRHIRPLPPQALEQLRPVSEKAYCWLQPENNGSLYELCGKPVSHLLSYALPDYQLDFKFQPGDFTQVNSPVNRHMVAQAIEWLAIQSDEDVADLFCGIGNFSLPIARFAKQVFAIEAEESMVSRGRSNALLNKLDNIDFRGLNLETQALTQILDRKQCKKVLLDPPRAGARFVCEQIAKSAVERLVYVSCNPASFARDSRYLLDAGFELLKLRVLDMFPQTAHLETMALFVRKS